MAEPRKPDEADPREERFSEGLKAGWAFVNASLMSVLGFMGTICGKTYELVVYGVVLVAVFGAVHWFLFKHRPRHLMVSIVIAGMVSWAIGMGMILRRVPAVNEAANVVYSLPGPGFVFPFFVLVEFFIIAFATTLVIGLVTQILVQRKLLGEKLFPKSTRRSFM